MRLAILQTGHNNPALPQTLRAYPQMFTDLLVPLAPNQDVEFTTYRVVDGEFPSDIHDHDGYIITGSRHGVYEDLPFIAPLMTFIKIVLPIISRKLAFVLAIKPWHKLLVGVLKNQQRLGCRHSQSQCRQNHKLYGRRL